jgi:hypothetical protein
VQLVNTPVSRAQRNRPNFLSSDRCAIFTAVSSYSEKADKLKNGNAGVTDSITLVEAKHCQAYFGLIHCASEI